MNEAVGAALALLALGFAAWLLPRWAVGGAVPLAKRAGRTVTNYRGESVPVALGVAWLAWSVGLGGCLAVSSMRWWFVPDMTAGGGARGIVASFVEYIGIVGATPLLLVVGAFALGMLDDVMDAGEAKGFSGHLAMLRQGQLSTGLFKLVGIGILSVAAGANVVGMRATADMPWLGFSSVVVWAAAASVLIASSANFLNLLDLRPGRALKAYAVLAAVPLLWQVYVWRAYGLATAGGLPQSPMNLVALFAVAFGPVLAVWSLDLKEAGMLGDAGANPMGAFAGWLWVACMPLSAVIVAAVVMVAMNLLSERISYSSVIDRVSVLRWLDSLGRVAPREGTGASS